MSGNPLVTIAQPPAVAERVERVRGLPRQAQPRLVSANHRHQIRHDRRRQAEAPRRAPAARGRGACASPARARRTPRAASSPRVRSRWRATAANPLSTNRRSGYSVSSRSKMTARRSGRMSHSWKGRGAKLPEGVGDAERAATVHQPALDERLPFARPPLDQQARGLGRPHAARSAGRRRRRRRRPRRARPSRESWCAAPASSAIAIAGVPMAQASYSVTPPATIASDAAELRRQAVRRARSSVRA